MHALITFTPTGALDRLSRLTDYGTVTFRRSPTGLRTIASFEPRGIFDHALSPATVMRDSEEEAITELYATVFEPEVIKA
jgi:hypothetical protein